MSGQSPDRPEPDVGKGQPASGWAGSPQPPANRRRAAASGPRKWIRAALLAAGALAVAVAVSASLAATGGHSTSASLSSEVAPPTKAPATPPSSSSAPASAGASSSPRAASPASAPWSSASCPNQLVSWRSTGADGQLQVVVTGFTITSQAAAPLEADLASGTASSAAVTHLRSAVTLLNSGIQAARKNLIPACLSGAHRAEVAGLTSLGDAVADFGNAIAEAAGGNYGTAQQGMRPAVTAVQSGSAKMAATIADLNRYGTR